MGKEATRVRRRERKNIASGVAHVSATFNNTMITITDVQGNTIAWSSSGTMGFKGSRNRPLMPPKLPPKTPPRRRKSTGCALLRSRSRDQAQAASRRCARSRRPALPLPRSAT
jgi:hypothetical protein